MQKKSQRLLRICFWIGAVIDGIMIFPMLVPKIGGAIFGIADFDPGVEYRYAMGVAASLMAGWTVLLIWGAQKPVQRKGILLITVLPVLLGLFIAGIYAVSNNFIPFGKMVPTWTIQIILVVLFTYGYFSSEEDQEFA